MEADIYIYFFFFNSFSSIDSCSFSSIDSCDGEPVFPLTARAVLALNLVLICLLRRHHLHHFPLDRWTPDNNDTHTHTPDGGLKTLV